MKIISWNVRGLGSYKKNTSVKDTFRKYTPDIVMLQETKKMETSRKCLTSIWEIKNIEWISSPAGGGVHANWLENRVV